MVLNFVYWLIFFSLLICFLKKIIFNNMFIASIFFLSLNWLHSNRYLKI